MAGPLYGLQRSQVSRTSGLSPMPVVLKPGSKGRSLATIGSAQDCHIEPMDIQSGSPALRNASKRWSKSFWSWYSNAPCQYDSQSLSL